MTENDNLKNQDSGTYVKAIEAATALAKAVPIYEDAIQPIAKEAGKALGTIGRAVNLALSPISILVWGYDQIRDFLETAVSEKLKDIPKERIITPPPNVAGPAIEALKFTGHNEILRNMFANLIANSLDEQTTLNAHPSFVEMIKNICPDEALILKLFSVRRQMPMLEVKMQSKNGGDYTIVWRNYTHIGPMSGCSNIQFVPNYLDNLVRLGLLEIPVGIHLSDQKHYQSLLNDPKILEFQDCLKDSPTHVLKCDKRLINPTGIGHQFINACVVDKK